MHRAPHTVDPATLDRAGAYALMTSALVPRPIAWIGTRSPEGVNNLAPFSYFMGVSAAPMRLAVSVSRGRGGALKDTLRNLAATGEATVSIVSGPQRESMHLTSAPWPPEVSEFEVAGLTPVQGTTVAAPWVGEARVAMECTLERTVELDGVHLVILDVRRLHLDPEVLDERGLVDPTRLDPVARLGNSYATLGPVTVLPPARLPDR